MKVKFLEAARNELRAAARYYEDRRPGLGREFRAQVRNAVDLIAQLIQSVEDLNLQRGIENSLKAKLNVAQKVLGDANPNNDSAAVNTLSAFIDELEAQRGKKIPVDAADALIADAQAIIDLLMGG